MELGHRLTNSLRSTWQHPSELTTANGWGTSFLLARQGQDALLKALDGMNSQGKTGATGGKLRVAWGLR